MVHKICLVIAYLYFVTRIPRMCNIATSGVDKQKAIGQVLGTFVGMALDGTLILHLHGVI